VEVKTISERSEQ